MYARIKLLTERGDERQRGALVRLGKTKRALASVSLLLSERKVPPETVLPYRIFDGPKLENKRSQAYQSGHSLAIGAAISTVAERRQ